MQETALPIPPHFKATGVDQVWRVPYNERAGQAAAWARQHDIEPASRDRTRACLLIVDCQNTFCIPGFELFVAGSTGRGAVDDNVRLCEFIYRNLGALTEIVVTLDTHMAAQIFHPLFWIDPSGEHPAGGQTIITVEDLERELWRVNPAVADVLAAGDYDRLATHAIHYARTLTAGGKYPLLVWPYHAMLGGIGHALVSAVEEALFFHGLARGTQPRFEVKGNNALTEHYSALRPEVLKGADDSPIAVRDEELIERLLGFDALIIAGQAKSHCVAWTVADLLGEIRARDEKLTKRVYLLEDCTSPVVVAGVIDFTEQADAAFERFAAAGIHVVRSTEPFLPAR